MWEKEKDKQLALMIYRNTPLDSGRSPSELLFKRSLRTNIPEGSNDTTEEEFRQRDRKLKERQKEHTDRRRRAKKQEELQSGDIVWVKTSEEGKGDRGIVVDKREEPDLYNIQMRGKILRTRKHLRKLQVDKPAEEGNSADSANSERETSC